MNIIKHIFLFKFLIFMIICIIIYSYLRILIIRNNKFSFDMYRISYCKFYNYFIANYKILFKKIISNRFFYLEKIFNEIFLALNLYQRLQIKSQFIFLINM